MAEKKEKVEKKIVKVEGKKEGAGKLRLASWILWALAIVCEVVAFLILNGTIYVPDEKFTTMFLIPLGIDFVLALVASQLWKKANDKDPASKKNGFKFFLQNQLGLIMTLICFVPLIIMLLLNKDLEKGTKKLVTVVAVIMLVVCGVFSIDWNPASAEDLAAAEGAAVSAGADTVYWTTFGKSFHYDQDCHSLSRSKTLYEGNIADAFAANRHDPCDHCVPQEGAAA
ncbi:MAG: hypothetical protein IJ987_03435 [Firmicutes bacterium]|nr:hypothetical protein [Bacillota bacterium]